MTENRGTRDDLPPEGGVDEVRYTTVVPVNLLDLRLGYVGEDADLAQPERVGDGTQS